MYEKGNNEKNAKAAFQFKNISGASSEGSLLQNVKSNVKSPGGDIITKCISRISSVRAFLL